MASLEIVQLGAPVLRERATPVPKKDIGGKELQALIKKMKAALRKEPYGVALAAPQMGKASRLFIVAGRVFGKPEGAEQEAPLRRDKHNPNSSAEPPALPDRVFINPIIVRRSRQKEEMSEGCLSVRGKYGSVLRHTKVTLEARDEAGKPLTYHASGLLAQIFQHECDHLDGILYIDKAAKLGLDDQKK